MQCNHFFRPLLFYQFGRMQFKSILSTLLCGVLFLCGCNSFSGDKVMISGSFSNLKEAQIYIYQLLPLSHPLIDSVKADRSGNFSIAIPVKKAGFYLLKVSEGNEITLVLSPGDTVSLRADANSLKKSYSVEGSKDSKLYFAYCKFTQSNLEKVDSLSRLFAEGRTKPDFAIVKQKLDSAYSGIYENQKQKVISFVNTNLNSLASLLVISEDFGPNPLLSEKTHPDLFLKLDSALFHLYPENSFVNKFHVRMINFKAVQSDAMAQSKLLMPGLPVPEITLPNAMAKNENLSTCEDKLTLVYFWSSWNALSRQTNMKLTSLYSRYHEKGFEIFAVSVDTDPDLWKKAYMLDKAYWKQVIDTSGLNSAYCKTFAVHTLPKLMLIDRNGKIISNDVDFMELDEMIRKTL